MNRFFVGVEVDFLDAGLRNSWAAANIVADTLEGIGAGCERSFGSTVADVDGVKSTRTAHWVNVYPEDPEKSPKGNVPPAEIADTLKMRLQDYGYDVRTTEVADSFSSATKGAFFRTDKTEPGAHFIRLIVDHAPG